MKTVELKLGIFTNFRYISVLDFVKLASWSVKHFQKYRLKYYPSPIFYTVFGRTCIDTKLMEAWYRKCYMSTCRQLFKEHFDTKHEWLLSVFIFYPACFQQYCGFTSVSTIARRSSILTSEATKTRIKKLTSLNYMQINLALKSMGRNQS